VIPGIKDFLQLSFVKEKNGADNRNQKSYWQSHFSIPFLILK